MFKRILKSKSLQARVKWILAVVMVPPFAFFFHLWAGGHGPSGPGGAAGTLFGRQVAWETFQEEYTWLRRGAAAQFGTIPESLEPYFRQQAWDRLMLKAEARRQVKATDQEVAQRIQEQSSFQDKDGRFSRQLYFDLVRGIGLSPAAFEDRLRDDLRIEKLLDKIKAEVRLTDGDVEQAYRDEHQLTKASLLAVREADFTSQVEGALTDRDVREAYAARPELVRKPARRVIEYLERTLADALAQAEPITEEDVQAYYDERAEDYTNEDGTLKPFEEVRVSVEQAVRGRRTQQRLTDLALDLEEDVERGLRFVEIALSRGLMATRIGPLARDQAPPANGPSASMIGGAFDVPLGRMTQVFNTPIGVFLLIPVEELPAYVPPLEEVRGLIKDRLVQERIRRAANRHAQELRVKLLAKQQEGLGADDAYKALGLEPLRPAPFTRTGPIEGLDAQADAAGALAETPAGKFSDIIPTTQGFVVGFVEERPPVDETAMAAEKDTFRETLLETRRQEHLMAWLAALRERARLKSFLESPASP